MASRPGWPEAEQLAFLAEHAGELLAAAAGLPPDRELAEAPRQVQHQHRPGAGVSALYELSAADGGSFLGVTTERLPEDRDTVRIEVPGESDRGPLTVTVWRHPHDPKLPGLPLAANPDRVEALWARGEAISHLEMVAYRPLRRAVLTADFSTPAPLVTTRRVYLKVMRSGLAEGLHRRHRMLADAGLPVPRPLGEPVEDVLALEEVAGEGLARLIQRDGGVGVDPAELTGLLDRIPDEALDLPERPAWNDRLGRYASAAAATLPEHAARVDALRQAIQRVLESSDRGPRVPSHGDFYEANLLMSGTRVAGLLDVDSVGPGYRVDDLACFLGHVAVLPAVDVRYTRVPRALDHFGGAFEAGVDRSALWARAAGVAVSLVAGARPPGGEGPWRRGAEGRLEAAERLLERVA